MDQREISLMDQRLMSMAEHLPNPNSRVCPHYCKEYLPRYLRF